MIRQRVFSALLCMLLICSALPLTAVYAVNYDNYSGFTIKDPARLPSQEVHPKLWFDQSQISSMASKRNADPYAASLWDSIAASPYLTSDFPNIPACPAVLTSETGSIIHHYYGDMARIAKYNAFMYMMQGGDNFLNRAIAALKRAYDGPIYSCPAIDPLESSSPVDETYRANWAQNFAAAYDWVQPKLTEQDDQLIRQRLTSEAQLLNEKLYVWGPRNHNHRSKPAWGLGSLALALSSHSSAQAWLQNAIDAANTNTSYYFSEDGLYREGSHYYIYSLINFVPFLYHYKNVSGMDYFPLYRPAFEWEFYTANNKGWMPNFEDSYLHYNNLVLVAGQFMGTNDKVPATLHPDAKWGNLFQWRYQATDKSPWDFTSADGSKVNGEFGNNTGASLDDTMDIDKYLTYEPSVTPVKPTGSATSFLDKGGETVFRNNWNENDPGSRYLIFHAVAETDNHNHFDTLSFAIQAENQMMASTPGYSRSAYGDDVRRSWYRTAEAGNMVTMDVKDSKGATKETWPVDYQENVTPTSKYSLDTDYFDFQQKEARYIQAVNDATQSEVSLTFPPESSTLASIKRAVAFPGQDYFVVVDQVSSRSNIAQNYNLYLHGGRGTMTGTGNHRLWTYAADTYGSEAKFSTWIFSDRAELSDKSGELTYIKGDYANYGYVKASTSAVNANFMQILVPLSKQEQEPKVTELSDSNRVGGTVEKDGSLDTFLVQQGSGTVTLGQLTTDGDFGYVKDKGSVAQGAARQASTLSYKGTVLFNASKRITMSMDFSQQNQLRTDITSEASDYNLQLRNPYGKVASNVTLMNDAGVASNISFTTLDGFTRLMGLNGGGHITVMYQDSADADKASPAAITDLTFTNISPTTVDLAWTATGDDEVTGTAAYYDIRYSNAPITEDNWSAAHLANREPEPELAGTRQTMKLTGLVGGTTYYIAIRAVDKAGNGGALSTAASITTPSFELTSVVWKDGNGNILSGLTASGIVSATVQATNYATEEASAQLIMALYKPNRTLLQMVSGGKYVKSGVSDVLQVMFKLPDAMPSGSFVKAFLWEGTDTLIPLSAPFTISQ
ncbi:fibronectin type III domain-containing protein [Paenibacillus ferrarius]|uniref:fibronectin type III domain-containing protein n=1 Tax=Paenibacillus ferrarius TaxID=1469647 RepID=UPI003D2DECD0